MFRCSFLSIELFQEILNAPFHLGRRAPAQCLAEGRSGSPAQPGQFLARVLAGGEVIVVQVGDQRRQPLQAYFWLAVKLFFNNAMACSRLQVNFPIVW